MVHSVNFVGVTDVRFVRADSVNFGLLRPGLDLVAGEALSAVLATASHYARADDEGRALLREVYSSPADLEILGDELHVRINPLSAPRRTKALAALCRRPPRHRDELPRNEPDAHLQHQGGLRHPKIRVKLCWCVRSPGILIETVGEVPLVSNLSAVCPRTVRNLTTQDITRRIQ